MTRPVTSTSRHEWSRRTGPVETESSEDEGEHRSDERPERDHADERGADGHRHETPVCSIVVEARQLPDGDAEDADHAQNGAEGDPGRELTRRDPPPVADLHLTEGQRTDDERRGL